MFMGSMVLWVVAGKGKGKVHRSCSAENNPGQPFLFVNLPSPSFCLVPRCFQVPGQYNPTNLGTLFIRLSVLYLVFRQRSRLAFLYSLSLAYIYFFPRFCFLYFVWLTL